MLLHFRGVVIKSCSFYGDAERLGNRRKMLLHFRRRDQELLRIIGMPSD